MPEIAFGDPWLVMTAFGLVASAGLLVYLVKQLNAASDDDETPAEEQPAEAPEPLPPPPPAPAPAAAPKKAETAAPSKSAADAISLAMGGPLGPMGAPAPGFAPSPAPLPQVATPPVPAPLPQVATPPAAASTAPAKSPSELSPAVAFIRALHEDIQTFHWEIQSLKKKLDKFEENQEKQIAAIAARLDSMETTAPAPKKEEGPPPTPFQ